ncbi:glycosyltransferase family 39 protein [bacterium]|nr:glycosyltransferase family 39 protein [bacterium]
MNPTRRTTLLLGLALLLLYILTQSSNLSSAHDAADYLLMMRNGEYFHPHHLLYNGAAALWTMLWQTVLPSLQAVTLVAWLNALFGAGCVAMLHLLLRERLSVPPVPALFGALLPGFSFGLWFYSVTVEVYVIPLFFLLLALYILSAERVNMRLVVAAGCAHALAMLFHQVHALFIVPAVVMIWLRFRRQPGPPWQQRPGRPLAAYTLTAGLGAALPYLGIGIFALGHRTPQSYFHWFFRYAGNSGFYEIPGPASLVKALIGFGKSIIGGEFLFAIPRMRELMQRLLPTKWLDDEYFLVRALPEWAALLLVLLSIAIVLLIAWMLLRARWRAAFRHTPGILIALTTFLGTYTLFFLVWEPSNPEFWIPQSAVFFLILIAAAFGSAHAGNTHAGSAHAGSAHAGSASDAIQPKRFASLRMWPRKSTHNVPAQSVPVQRTAVRTGVLVAAAVLLFIVNFAGSIYWLRSAENDMYAVRAHALSEAAGSDGLIIVADQWILGDMLALRGRENILSITEVLQSERNNSARAWKRIHDRVEALLKTGNPVIFSSDAIRSPHPLILSHGEVLLGVESYIQAEYAGRWEIISVITGNIYHLSH